jgi:hypothetical protein
MDLDLSGLREPPVDLGEVVRISRPGHDQVGLFLVMDVRQTGVFSWTFDLMPDPEN